MKVSVTREETVERNWACARCEARGVVQLRAVGESGWKQVWWSREAAEERAAEDAGWAVQRDADRMLGMIRCPSCRQRARGVYGWAVLRNLIPVFMGLLVGAAAALMTYVWFEWSPWTAIPFMFICGASALLPERRRWVEARETTVRGLVRAEKSRAAVPKATARELPTKKPELLAPITTHAPQQIERAADAEGPRFLRDA